MLTLSQMLTRLGVAVVLGGILGVEREFVGKEAGVRTEIVVAAGAAMFAMIGITLPYLTVPVAGALPDATAAVSAFGVIASVVSGIGFLGAGLIIKMNDHPRGLTTAALVWTTAAIGILAGVGMIEFAAVASIGLALLLYILRKLNISEKLENHPGTPQ